MKSAEHTLHPRSTAPVGFTTSSLRYRTLSFIASPMHKARPHSDGRLIKQSPPPPPPPRVRLVAAFVRASAHALLVSVEHVFCLHFSRVSV